MSGKAGKTGANVNSAAQALLPVPSNQETFFSDTARSKPPLSSTFYKLVVVCVANVAVTAALFVVMCLADARASLDQYTIRGSMLDVACVCLMRSLHTCVIGATGRPVLYTVLRYLTAAYLVLVLAKIMLYDRWGAAPAYGAPLLATAEVVFMAVEIVLLGRLQRQHALSKAVPIDAAKEAALKKKKKAAGGGGSDDAKEMTLMELMAILRP